MFEGPLRLWVNWTIVDTIDLKGNKFVMGVKIKAAVDTKLNGSPDVTRRNEGLSPYNKGGRGERACV